MFSSRTITLVALAASATAQSLTSGLSTTCTNALTGIATNPDAAACLSPGSLLSLVAGGANSSIVSPINSWLTSLCGSPACSNATLAAVVSNVTSGCSAELSDSGISSDTTASVTALVQQYYPTVRKVVCLKDGSTNCITQTLTNVEAVIGTLSLTNLLSLTANTPNLPSNVTCTNCVKAAYNVINTDIPSIISDAAPSLQSQCGSSFTDGTTPSGILQSASTASAGTTSSGALGAVSIMSQSAISALGVSGLLVLSTVFTVLA